MTFGWPDRSVLVKFRAWVSRKGRFLIVMLSVFLWALLWPTIFSNTKNLVDSFITGEKVLTEPLPLYGYLHIKNDDPLFKDYTFALDFAAVYFTAKNFDKKDVYTGKYDPWGRPTPHTPAALFFYSKTFCKLPFWAAASAHLAFQAVLLLLATFFIFQYYRIAFLFVPVSLVYAVMLTCSPVGLAWFERGQFDIFAGLSLLFLMFGIYESKGYAFALAALFAAFKLTMALFFIQAFILYLLICPGRAKWRFFAVFSGILLLVLISFPQHLMGFLTELQRIQSSYVCGMTLVDKLPPVVSVLIPVFCTLLFLIPALLSSRKKEMFTEVFLPYMTGLAGINLLLLANNWEYRIICYLGLLPMMIVWYLKFSTDLLYRYEVMAFFVLFLAAAFHMFWVISTAVSADGYLMDGHLIAAYIAFYLAIMVVSLPRMLFSGNNINSMH
jgi:hypothetical protein